MYVKGGGGGGGLAINLWLHATIKLNNMAETLYDVCYVA